MLKNCVVALCCGLISSGLSAQVVVSRLAPAGLAPHELMVSLDSLFAGKSYQPVAALFARSGAQLYVEDQDEYPKFSGERRS
jgi:hypothetical protein